MTVPEVDTFTAAARAFSATATAAAQSGTADASVLSQLNGLPPLCATAIAALQAASTAPEVGEAVSACEVLLALCSSLGDSLLAQQPNITTFVLPTDMAPMVVLERFYGAQAFAHVDEFEAANPEVLGMVLIPSGRAVKIRGAVQSG